MLDIHQLNVFLVAAQTLNFTRAAQRLQMTQPSVSQHIQSLEKHFDDQLFYRSGRNIELTEAGQALMPLAREAVTLSTRIEETMASQKGEISGHLLVGCSTTPGKYVLPPLLAQFHSKHPQVRLTCQVIGQSQALQQLCEGEIHFTLTSLPEPSCPGLEIQPYLTDDLELIVPADHPWACREEIEFSELVETQFLMREPGSGTYEILHAQLTQVGIAIESLDVLLTLGNSEAIVLAVKEGLGAAFVSRIVVEKLGQESVAAVPVAGLNLEREIFFARNAQRPATAAQNAFWEYILHKHQTALPPVKTFAD